MKLKEGDMIKTPEGIEKVLYADDAMVKTYESARRLNHWHPSKVIGPVYWSTTIKQYVTIPE